jgi:CheY-like chemotaxis protein
MMKKVLIVEDELAILTGLSKALRELCRFLGDIRSSKWQGGRLLSL